MSQLLQEVEGRVQAIVWPVYRNGQVVERTLHGLPEIRQAVSEITQMQKQLKLLKSEINAEMKEIKLSFAQRKTNVQANPFVGILIGKKNAGHMASMHRQQLRQAEYNAVSPYQNAAMSIDRFILLLDQMKTNINRQVVEQQSQH
jgi:hypothetical protein